MMESSLTYGRGQRLRNRNKPIDFKKLAGETVDFSYENGSNNNDDSVTSSNSNNLNYANKHIFRVINCNLDASDAQVVDDGNILTADNLKDPNHPLSLRKYIFINDTPESIGMKIPYRSCSSSSRRRESLSIRDIGGLIGMSHPVTVINVRNQEEMDGWTVGDLVEYFEDEDRIYQNASRHRCNDTSPSIDIKSSQQLVLNQISLEFSHTALKSLVRSPKFVRDLDWIDAAWPKHRKDQNDVPTVQYYCLTSTAGCYTDFHIDFGGSSVWYHVISGEKMFLLLPPTKKNVRLYEQWLCSKNQSDIFFPDMQDGEDRAERCSKVILKKGQTFVIPGGWIHAVYTPIDSIVFGGNFLHGLDIKCQLDIYCLETRIRVPAKFRFPYFVRMMFYAIMFYYKKTQRPNEKVCREEIDGLPNLIDALKVWSIQPKEDVDRVGSIAHTIQECLSEFSNDLMIDDLLVAMQNELEKLNGNSHTPKNGRILKIRLKPHNIPLEHSNDTEQKVDQSSIGQNAPPASVMDSSENSENDFQISLCPNLLFDFKPMPDSSSSRRKPRKIEDLISRQKLMNEGDDEWIPRPKKQNNKQKKTHKLSSTLSKPKSSDLPSKVFLENDDHSVTKRIEPISPQSLSPKSKSTSRKCINSHFGSKTNFQGSPFIRKQMKKSSMQKGAIKNTSARQRLAKRFKF